MRLRVEGFVEDWESSPGEGWHSARGMSWWGRYGTGDHHEKHIRYNSEIFTFSYVGNFTFTKMRISYFLHSLVVLGNQKIIFPVSN